MISFWDLKVKDLGQDETKYGQNRRISTITI